MRSERNPHNGRQEIQVQYIPNPHDETLQESIIVPKILEKEERIEICLSVWKKGLLSFDLA